MNLRTICEAEGLSFVTPFDRDDGVVMLTMGTLRRIAERAAAAQPEQPTKPRAHALQMVVIPGEIRVNSATLLHSSHGIVCITVDLASKYAKVLGFTGGPSEEPCVMLEADEDTLNADTARLGDATEIQFPSHPGWSVFAHQMGRYSLSLVLVKPTEE